MAQHPQTNSLLYNKSLHTKSGIAPVDVVGARVFGWWDYLAYCLLTVFIFASVIDFGWHWFSHYLWLLYPSILFVLTLIMALKLMEQIARWLMLPLMRKPEPVTAATGLKVAVVTTFVASGEPLAMLEKTLNALVAIDYPHDTWVLDEDDDAFVKALCRRLGANHFSRKNLPHYQQPDGQFKSRSKHGNYNAWLNEIGFDSYEFVTAFDPDHIPHSTFLTRTLGYFQDPEIGYVQAPAAYYNQDASFIAGGAAEETYSYYSCTQMAAHALGHPFVTGCHNSHRVVALKQAGGFAAHNADDLLLTLLYRNRGWRGVYVPEILARGLVPADWNGYLEQQVRWARSIMDVKFRRYFAVKLPAKERLIAFLDGIVYLQSSATVPVLIVLLSLMLVTGMASGLLSTLTLLKFATLCAVLQLAALFRQRFFLNPSEERGLHWRAKVMRYAKWPYVLKAFGEVLLRREAPYTLTRKKQTATRTQWMLWPHLLTILCTSAALIAGIIRGHYIHPVLYACAAALIVGTSVLVLTERMESPLPYDESDLGEATEQKGVQFTGV